MKFCLTSEAEKFLCHVHGVPEFFVSQSLKDPYIFHEHVAGELQVLSQKDLRVEKFTNIPSYFLFYTHTGLMEL